LLIGPSSPGGVAVISSQRLADVDPACQRSAATKNWDSRTRRSLAVRFRGRYLQKLLPVPAGWPNPWRWLRGGCSWLSGVDQFHFQEVVAGVDQVDMLPITVRASAREPARPCSPGGTRQVENSPSARGGRSSALTMQVIGRPGLRRLAGCGCPQAHDEQLPARQLRPSVRTGTLPPAFRACWAQTSATASRVENRAGKDRCPRAGMRSFTWQAWGPDDAGPHHPSHSFL